MIVVVGGIKGGTGKTTIATNLTVLRAEEKKVLLVDADEQGSALDWANQRDGLGIETSWSTVKIGGENTYKQLERLRESYDDIIVDAGGRGTSSLRSALMAADLFLVPFKPRSLDIWTIGEVKRMISEIKTQNQKLVCVAVINQADSRGTDNADAASVIDECPDLKCLRCSIGHRKAFSNAAAEGLGVTELKNIDRKAVQEVRELYESVYQMCLVC